ncbi:protein MIS12 homolog isoform X2 [Solanum lycopersicum]|uniref:protein MIS12 homolog isoform X2 n=1 Tax=Solanum lycopersicum TaxID=4081 RepID=UPI000532D786|nr:protein MIS12 homolog isoform X2 [Solanum lycopersicum]
MEGSESEKVFDSLNLNPQLFINEALNCVDDLVDDAFDFFHQEAAKLLKTEGTDRSEDLRKDGPSSASSLDTNCIENPEIDSKLNFLRKKLSQVGKESAELKRELQALESQSMLSGRSAASLTEALELYQQQSVNEKFEELVRTASDFHTKLETLTAKMMEDTEHPRAKRSRVSNGELYRMNNNKGLLSVTMEELQELVDDIKTLRD